MTSIYGYFVHGLKDGIKGLMRSMCTLGPLSHSWMMNLARVVELELQERKRIWTRFRTTSMRGGKELLYVLSIFLVHPASFWNFKITPTNFFFFLLPSSRTIHYVAFFFTFIHSHERCSFVVVFVLVDTHWLRWSLASDGCGGGWCDY